MIIRFKKKRLYINLGLGIMWSFFGISKIFLSEEEPSWIDYGFLLIGVLYLLLFYYEYKNQYLFVGNGIIKENGFLGKKLEIDKINQIRKFAGEYILKSEEKEMRININSIEKDSLHDLEQELEKLKMNKNLSPL